MSGWKSSPLKRAEAAAISAIGYRVCAALGATLKWRVEGLQHYDEITLDGPRGPGRVAQPGAVWLSKATGNPVLPFHLEADRHWTVKSWDQTQIPKPFSTIALVVGQPFVVPKDADDAEIEGSRRHLEEQLRALESRARELARSPR